MTTRQCFFVIGAERCGTTLLQLCLGAHSRIAVPFEAQVSLSLDSLYRAGHASTDNQAALIDALYRKEPKLTAWGLDRDRLVGAFRDSMPSTAGTAADVFFDAYCNQFRPKAAYWGDKNPIHVYAVERLRELHPGARFIYLIRDPRAMLASVLKRVAKGRWTGMSRSVLSAGAIWQMAAKRYLAAAADGYRLRYEDLVTDPSAELSRLCEWLGLPFEPAMIARKTPDERQATVVKAKFFGTPLQFEAVASERRDAWRDELTTSQIEAVESLHESLMTRLGYEPVTNGTRLAGKALLMREALTAPHRQKFRFWLKTARFKAPATTDERMEHQEH